MLKAQEVCEEIIESRWFRIGQRLQEKLRDIHLQPVRAGRGKTGSRQAMELGAFLRIRTFRRFASLQGRMTDPPVPEAPRERFAFLWATLRQSAATQRPSAQERRNSIFSRIRRDSG